jgi:hypothetical protein
VPQNLVFIVVGDVEPAHILEQVRQQFASFPRTTERGVVMPDEPEQASPRSARTEMQGETTDFAIAAASSALQPDNSKAGIYQPTAVLPVQALKIKSEQRVLSNPYFKTISLFNNWLREYKTGRTIPLQWNTYSTHYSRILDMFKALGSGDTDEPVGLAVTNNGFDRQRINASTEHSKEINATYIKHVQKDIALAEACKIMLDWINR